MFREIKNGAIHKIHGDLIYLTIIVFEEEGCFEYYFSEGFVISYRTTKNIIKCGFVEDEFYLNQGLKNTYEEIPSEHPYRIFAFLDEEGCSVLKIFTSAVKIRKMEENEI